MAGCSVDSNVDRIDRTPARLVGEPSLLGQAAGYLRWDNVGDRGLECFPAVITDRVFASTALTPPVNWAGSHSIIPG